MQPKMKKILIAGSIVGVIALVAGFLIVRRRKTSDVDKGLLAGFPNVEGLGDKPVGKLIEWPLKYGSGYLSDSERNSVRTVQIWLNKKIIENNVYALPILTVDGYFGSRTENALQKIAGVKQVSYTLHNTMENYNKSAPIAGFDGELFSTNKLE